MDREFGIRLIRVPEGVFLFRLRDQIAFDKKVQLLFVRVKTGRVHEQTGTLALNLINNQDFV